MKRCSVCRELYDPALGECPECLKDKALDAKLNAFAAGCADILGGRIG